MRNKCCSGTGKEGKTKEVEEDREVKQVVCEELCVTKFYVKDGVWQSVTKLCVCVIDGVWQSWVWQSWVWQSCGVTDVVWQSCVCVTKLCVTKLAVKNGVWQRWVWKMVCDKVGCERWCVTKLCVTDGRRRRRRRRRDTEVPQVPRLPRETKVDVTKCHVCHVKRRWMSPSATPATQSTAASPATNRAQARHQSQPSAASVTPATISWYYHYHQWLGDGHRKQRNNYQSWEKTKNIITIKSWSMIMSPLKGCAERHECSKTWWLIIWLS